MCWSIFGVDVPDTILELEEGDEVVILDTNNPEELPKGIDKADIVEIIDHHKLVGGLSTESPLSVTMRPLGSTSTIVWQLIDEYEEVEVPADMAGLMLAGILSDTLNFTSPTTTEDDKEAAAELAEIAGKDINSLADKMFAAKSDLSGMDTAAILTMDSKVFDLGGKVRVSVLETTDPQVAKDMTDDLKTGMEKMTADEGLDHMFFFIVDILNSEAFLLASSDEARAAAEKAFEGTFEGDYLRLPGVVSRKKQMIPALEGVLK
ncbi:MAG: putative manganese-dependent inorganic pyrophosphatase [candidate division WS6 bacterium OLB20]|uniref:inorganic diphosphatase n=1 Tax=candidate division WS6 bacterium OLB20 TaxID=1617426 RepID=A0A136LZM6_9BACT|nr:MAG: putative manganese-dependent inorganic pyrophosphatase [candidate division WS6 bacterium OLB20]